ncbi:MAG: hypothetical protein V8T45_06725 [Oscillospiraceae bacterium]
MSRGKRDTSRPGYGQRPPPPGELRACGAFGPEKEPIDRLEELGKALPERIGELETEDVIILLILYLMYRESGDSKLLVIMGAMFLL